MKPLTPWPPLNSAPSNACVPIDLGERSYDILIGQNLLEDTAAFAHLPKASQAFIITNTTVGPLYAQQLQSSIAHLYAEVHTLSLPDGEQYKELNTLNSIFDVLLKHSADRKTVLYALGGGVIGDMVGFAAACYMRGIPFVQIPTTLLAQVDSSVGGKTAINHALGKNMIGAFYQPLKVICDLNALGSLPQREFCAGLAEIIKYGPIADAAFFDWIENNIEALLNRDPKTLSQAIARSCEIKAWVVSQDEKETGLRAILNFGHTFGHAIETGMGYGQWLHGEAVAAGMVMAAHLSVLMGWVEESFPKRMRHLLKKAQLPIQGPNLGIERYLELMKVDKKNESGQIKFVLIGSASLTTGAANASHLGQAQTHTVPEHFVRQVLLENIA